MPLPRKKKEEAEEQDQYEPELHLLTKEQLSIIDWRTKCLIKAGFDTWHAARLAGLPHLNWREAEALKAKGATQALVYELLS